MANQGAGHDWSKYPESPGIGRSGWLVVREPDEEGFAVEALVMENLTVPVQVVLVSYGPRGGTRFHGGGTVEGLREQISTAMQLKEIAQHLEEARRT